MSSAAGLKIMPEIKKCKSMIKKKKKKCDEIVLFAKTKLNNIEVIISKVLIESCISHDEFVSVNNDYKMVKRV